MKSNYSRKLPRTDSHVSPNLKGLLPPTTNHHTPGHTVTFQSLRLKREDAQVTREKIRPGWGPARHVDPSDTEGVSTSPGNGACTPRILCSATLPTRCAAEQRPKTTPEGAGICAPASEGVNRKQEDIGSRPHGWCRGSRGLTLGLSLTQGNGRDTRRCSHCRPCHTSIL